MNIWYISKYATPIKYFFGTRHFYLAEEWVKKGHKVSIITSNSSHLAKGLPSFTGLRYIEEINGVQTVWLNTIKSKKASSLLRMLSWLHFDLLLMVLLRTKRLPRPDSIIVSSLALTTIIPGWLLAKRYKAKLIFEVRDIWPLSIIVLGGYSKKNPLIRMLAFIERFGYKNADLIVGTMPNLAAHVNAILSKEVNCVCIPQGVSKDFYEKDQELISDAYKSQWIPHDKFIVCYAGTLNPNNPIDKLISCAELLQLNNYIHFIIIGEGNQKERLMNLAKGLPNVSFPPPVKRKEVNSVLRHVHLCYDSFESELAVYGLSRNKWIDYMFAAKPVICSFDGFQSMLNEAKCGTFVPYNDIKALADTVRQYAQMPTAELKAIGERGKSYLLANRTFDKLADNYLGLLKGI